MMGPKATPVKNLDVKCFGFLNKMGSFLGPWHIWELCGDCWGALTSCSTQIIGETANLGRGQTGTNPLGFRVLGYQNPARLQHGTQLPQKLLRSSSLVCMLQSPTKNIAYPKRDYMVAPPWVHRFGILLVSQSPPNVANFWPRPRIDDGELRSALEHGSQNHLYKDYIGILSGYIGTIQGYVRVLKGYIDCIELYRVILYGYIETTMGNHMEKNANMTWKLLFGSRGLGTLSPRTTYIVPATMGSIGATQWNSYLRCFALMIQPQGSMYMAI